MPNRRETMRLLAGTAVSLGAFDALNGTWKAPPLFA